MSPKGLAINPQEDDWSRRKKMNTQVCVLGGLAYGTGFRVPWPEQEMVPPAHFPKEDDIEVVPQPSSRPDEWTTLAFSHLLPKSLRPLWPWVLVLPELYLCTKWGGIRGTQ